MIKALENIPETDPLAMPEKRAIIDQVLEENGTLPGAAMVVLNELQSRIGYVSTPMQAYVARKLRVPMSQITGVVSFYSFFTTAPRGRHTVKLCMGTACYVGGTPQLIEKAQQVLGVKPGQTTSDNIDDASITAQVKASLRSHRSTSALKTTVETTDGVVTLSGIAKNAAEKSLVTKLANDVNGVSSVVNNMTIETTLGKN